MKIILTGAAGFLGSHISDRLIKEGHSVIGLDDLSTGSMANLEHLLDHPKFNFFEHDVREAILIKGDAILNFACPASPVHYQKFPVQTIRTSILGTLNALEEATRLGIPILQASTSEVYGDPESSPQAEAYWGNVNPIGVRACYDEGKRAAETLMMDYRRQYNTQIKIVRIFNTYGPRMRFNDGRVVSNFIVQALSNKPITIYGDGTQTRSFCFVDDLIEVIQKIASTDVDITGPVNIGNDKEFSMIELASTIIRLTNSNSEITFETLPGDDPKQRKPDLTYVKSLVNWEAKTNLEEGLKKTIDDFKSRIARGHEII
jgi:UDP-glucuronate decarboxylase